MKPTQEQVIAWAREAGISTPWDQEPVPWKLLTGFATLSYEAGRKDENEACAKVCEKLLSAVSTGDEHMDGVWDCISAIRARREQ